MNEKQIEEVGMRVLGYFGPKDLAFAYELFAENRRRTENRNTECTCPSGDGSLRWPCPQHPTGTEAGFDLDLNKLVVGIDDVLREHTELSTAVIDDVTPKLIEAVEAALARRAAPATTDSASGEYERGYAVGWDDGHIAGREKARASLAPVSAQPGYKLVPMEPTPEMQQAGHDTPGAHMYNASYRAMVAAAPVSAQQGAAVVEIKRRLRNMIANHDSFEEGYGWALTIVENVEHEFAAKAPAAQADLSATGLLKLWRDAEAQATDTMPAPFHFARMLLAASPASTPEAAPEQQQAKAGDRLIRAVRNVLAEGNRGTSGRIILDRYTEQELREAIDAAMRATQQEGGNA
jgi:hypothetical protein